MTLTRPALGARAAGSIRFGSTLVDEGADGFAIFWSSNLKAVQNHRGTFMTHARMWNENTPRSDGG
jgi:hypothetical protein